MSDPLDKIPCLKDWAGKKICVSEHLDGVPIKIGADSCEVALYFPEADSALDVDLDTDKEWAEAKKAIQGKIKRAEAHNFPGQKLTLTGTVTGPGIFGNPYRLGQLKAYFGQGLVDGKGLPVATMLDICTFYGLLIEPIIKEDVPVEEFVLGQTLEDLSNGKSLLLNGIRRKGIVITLMDGSLGMGQVSPVWKGA